MATVKAPNVVQAEFFYPAGQIDLPGTKTVVRFFDENGSITPLAQKFKRTKQKHENTLASFMDAKNSLRKMWLEYQLRHLASKMLVLKEQVWSLAKQKMNTAVEIPNSIAVECSDYSFRRAERGEVYQPYEAAHRATNAWFFVFEPNDLLADKNESVASVM